MSNITLEQAVSVWKLYKQGVAKTAIADTVKVSVGSVDNILKGRQQYSEEAERIAQSGVEPGTKEAPEAEPKQTEPKQSPMAKLLSMLPRETLERELLNRL